MTMMASIRKKYFKETPYLNINLIKWIKENPTTGGKNNCMLSLTDRYFSEDIAQK